MAIAVAGVLAIGVMGIPVHADGNNSTDYMLIIPKTVEVETVGWNGTDGITAYNASRQFDGNKKLVITASSANDDEGKGWSLVSGDYSVGYNLAAVAGDYSSEAIPASWEFSADELNAEEKTTKTMGIIVDDYETQNKPVGNYTDTVTFTAKVQNDAVAVAGVTITNAPTEALFVNSTGTLTAIVSPDNATDQTVTWSSSDPDYVSINETTGEYTVMGTKGYGSATITATATNGTEDTSDDVTTTCTITGKVHHTSLQVGDVIRVGETIYTGDRWYVDITPSTNFTTSNGVITLVEATTGTSTTKYYKCQRGSNGTMPNWNSFKVTDSTDGIYIVSGTGTSSDKFVFAVHTTD